MKAWLALDFTFALAAAAGGEGKRDLLHAITAILLFRLASLAYFTLAGAA